jgi:hypothetical protein
MLPKTILQAFKDHTSEAADGCIIWLGAKTHNGYGQLRNKGRAILAHRAMWELWCGPIPTGMLVCHRCDTRSCVRIDHLFLGTAADNSSDMVQKGRSHDLRGERSPRAKLTAEQVAKIRRRAGAGETCGVLAREFGFSTGAMSRVIRGERYK